MTTRALTDWSEKKVESKSIIVLGLGDTALAKTRSIVNYDARTTKKLWDDIQSILKKSSTQEISNLNNRLNGLMYNEHNILDECVSAFLPWSTR